MNNVGSSQPGAGQPGLNAGTPSNVSGSSADNMKRRLNMYIYDYFLRNHMFDAARALYSETEIQIREKPSPDRKGANGTSDEADQKDDIPGKPADLPYADIPSEVNNCFLSDWWSQFWDIWSASRTKNSNTLAKQYLGHVQNSQRMIGDRVRLIGNPQMQQAINARNGMMPNGMPNGVPITNDMKKAMMMGQRGAVPPAQLQQMRLQHQQQQAAQMAQQGQMQREGSQVDMNGQPRPQTPGSGEAPSPKRQRIEGGNFNGQMMPMGRGQNPGLNMQMQQGGANPQQSKQQIQSYANSMRQHAQNAMDPEAQKALQQQVNGMGQSSPGMDANSDFMNANGNGMRPGGQANGANASGSHALQDYQMQLMLLEQQNKKRLLMAREAQDGVSTVPINGQGGNFAAPAVSPSNSRSGPSPNPDDQMKRGTPKMAPGGIPQQAMDGVMQGRASPAPGFDPNQMLGVMAANMQSHKMPAGMMGSNGQLMPTAAAAHPAFNAQMNGQVNGQITAQQMQLMHAQAQMKPGGPWIQGGPHPGMMHGPTPQMANMTPQQRNSNMPPPPAPAAGDAQTRTQPSSPSQLNAAPPTPSQTNKPNPKKKADNKQAKKPALKKGQTAATPASEAGDQPPTPTPAPPITPTAASTQFKQPQAGPGPLSQQGMPQQGAQAGQAPQDMGATAFSSGLENTDMQFTNMDFGSLDQGEMLDGFDFDSFLNNDIPDTNFSFDDSLNLGGGLEAAGDI